MSDVEFQTQDYTDKELEVVLELLKTPMTPYDFRQALQKHPFLNYVGVMYDALLAQKIQRKRMRPVQAELSVMKVVKKWWIREMTTADKNRLERQYARVRSSFFINLTRHMPAILSENHWDMLERGIAPRKYKKILLKFLKPDVVAHIDRRITELGDDNIFHIKILETTPNEFSIGVQVVTEDEYLRIKKRQG